ncbi:MAG: thioredoxin family protein [Actinobacteria bacterium]|nr:thioredoxin family protein [Actinomycetota bacterium]MCB8997594.1 thioredoxin family protein [Actinomycetota bacterium]MCB9414583.1 thioredoxin family protein [Actinomycetota bacterium]MCB9423827.1 thioredoxin family protein [Actinomycetota bacterium]HRY09451.1 thioredoxin family protein [Candidatus Nanopelagicales bacterium]
MSGIMILAAIAVLLGVFGVWRRAADGRMRSSARADTSRLSAAQIGDRLGEQATLVQFTSAFCAPCRATRRILDEVAQMVPGVKHVDLDVEQHLDLARELNISRTPTVLVLDAGGAIVRRASGQPRKADVIAALGEAMPA